jgi:hypothetical protein
MITTYSFDPVIVTKLGVFKLTEMVDEFALFVTKSHQNLPPALQVVEIKSPDKKQPMVQEIFYVSYLLQQAHCCPRLLAELLASLDHDRANFA